MTSSLPQQAPPPQSWLPSWTRTLNEPEALTLLELAVPGRPLAEWIVEGHAAIPQGSLARRRELVGIVRDELLDWQDGAVKNTAFLQLFHGGSASRRRGLVRARLLSQRPLILPALTTLVRPALLRSEAPLAPADAGLIPASEWDRWLRSVLRPGLPEEAFKKTRSTLHTALAMAGCITIIGQKTRLTRATRGAPDSVALAWALADQLRRGAGECDEAWAVAHSFPALLFAPRAGEAGQAVEVGIAHGILRRSFLAGRARLLAGEA
ncbi:hypothetical protein LBMAG42_03590 [Deltaproteobacteria bacterium]|nr:hypothetical protein LBMAG42_03590 [Deltaproteobacteria bacterium]